MQFHLLLYSTDACNFVTEDINRCADGLKGLKGLLGIILVGCSQTGKKKVVQSVPLIPYLYPVFPGATVDRIPACACAHDAESPAK